MWPKANISALPTKLQNFPYTHLYVGEGKKTKKRNQ